VKINTSKFGEVDIAEEKVIRFPRGILGFDHLKSYFIMDYKDTAVKWLQSTDDPDAAFMIMDPFEHFPEYKPDLSPVDRRLLDVNDVSDVVVLSIITVVREEEQDPYVTMNLQAPLVFNVGSMVGFQVVMEKCKFGVNEIISLQTI